MVNTDITSLFRMPRAPCFPHTHFCQINFDILRIIDSSLNFKCDTSWGRNSQSVLQSRVSENKGITPGRRSTLTWRKGFNQLHNLTDSDNRLNEGKSQKESNSVIGEPHVSHRGGTVPEPPSFPRSPLSSTTQSRYTTSKYALAPDPDWHVLAQAFIICQDCHPVCLYLNYSKKGTYFSYENVFLLKRNLSAYIHVYLLFRVLNTIFCITTNYCCQIFKLAVMFLPKCQDPPPCWSFSFLYASP